MSKDIPLVQGPRKEEFIITFGTGKRVNGLLVFVLEAVDVDEAVKIAMQYIRSQYIDLNNYTCHRTLKLVEIVEPTIMPHLKGS